MQWTYSFWGKHPAFTDYIRVNADEALFYAIIQWLGKQAPKPPAPGDNGSRDGQSSRFWIVLPNTSRLTCGLIMSSEDHTGRHSPALCTLTGFLPAKPEDYWEKISQYCLATWHDMAHLLDCRFSSVSDFKAALFGITPPEWNARHDCPEDSRMDSIRQSVRLGLTQNKSMFIRDKMLQFTVDSDNSGRMDGLQWSRAIREAIDVMPFSWFIRNAGRHRQLYLYYRPLTGADFHMMQNSR